MINLRGTSEVVFSSESYFKSNKYSTEAQFYKENIWSRSVVGVIDDFVINNLGLVHAKLSE